ncbi:MAG: LamG domain-containing protein, partial [Planctomycetota bacterium]
MRSPAQATRESSPRETVQGRTVSTQRHLPLDEWVHVCAQVINGQHQYYINGEDAGTGGAGATLLGTQDTATVLIGRTQEGANRSWGGLIDDARIYNRGLSQEEIQTAMFGQGQPLAFGPNPEDAALVQATWATLSWTPGDFAVTHDVYLGENFDDVNDGTHDSPVFQGNQLSTMFIIGFAGFPYPDGLVPGTTYYWRIDEVNDANAASPWKGQTWSFWIPPKKAYDASPPDGATYISPDVTLSWTGGFGAKLHTVYFGDDLDTVTNATGG